jgi:Cu/Ag efflux pump CusA
MGGLITSTLLTLIVLPTIYALGQGMAKTVHSAAPAIEVSA